MSTKFRVWDLAALPDESSWRTRGSRTALVVDLGIPFAVAPGGSGASDSREPSLNVGTSRERKALLGQRRLYSQMRSNLVPEAVSFGLLSEDDHVTNEKDLSVLRDLEAVISVYVDHRPLSKPGLP